MDPIEGGVLSICNFQGGFTYNVVPEVVRMQGTARWLVPAVGDVLEHGLTRIVTGIAESMGARGEIIFKRNYPATVNDPAATVRARRAAETVAGAARVSEMAKPSMGSEDFAFMLEAKPGSYIMLGARKNPDDAMVHHPRFDFNDDVLPIGAWYWATLAEQLLPRKG